MGLSELRLKDSWYMQRRFREFHITGCTREGVRYHFVTDRWRTACSYNPWKGTIWGVEKNLLSKKTGKPARIILKRTHGTR